MESGKIFSRKWRDFQWKVARYIWFYLCLFCVYLFVCAPDLNMPNIFYSNWLPDIFLNLTLFRVANNPLCFVFNNT